MANYIELTPQGFIYQKLNKGMTEQDLLDDQPVLKRYEQQLLGQGKPALYLLDATEVGTKANTKVRKQGVANLNEMNYTKLAIFGIAPPLRAVANFVLSASNKSKGIQMFDSREQAEEWLSVR